MQTFGRLEIVMIFHCAVVVTKCVYLIWYATAIVFSQFKHNTTI